MKNLLLIINPVAGKGLGKSRLFKAVDIFTDHGYRVTVLPTAPNGKTEKAIIEEAKNYDLAVAIGGDGTLNTVASGIMKSKTDLPLGYIPLGSTNDFGSSLGLSKNINDACAHIAKNEPKPLDIGQFGDKYFVYIACTGLFAAASYMTSQQMKNAFGHGAYLVKGFLELSEIQKARYTIELENETIGGNFLYTGVSNTLRIGGIVKMKKKEVEFDDGLFELSLIKTPTNIKDGTALTGDLLYSNLDTHNFLRRKIKKAIIRCDNPRGWSIDGENGGEVKEAAVEVIKHGLRFIY